MNATRGGRTASFGQQLRTWREERGLTQEQLAERSDLKQADISHLERDRSELKRPEVLRRIAGALDLPAIDVFIAGGWLTEEDRIDQSDPELAHLIAVMKRDPEFMTQVRALEGVEEETLRDVVDAMRPYLRILLKQRESGRG